MKSCVCEQEEGKAMGSFLGESLHYVVSSVVH